MPKVILTSFFQIATSWTSRAAIKVRISPSRGRNARGPRSLTHKYSSSSDDSITRGTYPGRRGLISRPPWSWQRPRLKYGSRTADTKPNVDRWLPIWWHQLRLRKKWPWKFWCGTTRDSTTQENFLGPRYSLSSLRIIIPTHIVSLHGRCPPALQINEKGDNNFEFQCIYFFQKKRQLFDLDLKGKKKNTQDCSKRIDHCKLPHGIHVLTDQFCVGLLMTNTLLFVNVWTVKHLTLKCFRRHSSSVFPFNLSWITTALLVTLWIEPLLLFSGWVYRGPVRLFSTFITSRGSLWPFVWLWGWYV